MTENVKLANNASMSQEAKGISVNNRLYSNPSRIVRMPKNKYRTPSRTWVFLAVLRAVNAEGSKVSLVKSRRLFRRMIPPMMATNPSQNIQLGSDAISLNAKISVRGRRNIRDD